ncbi:MAG: hypothetical protein COY40_01910 [Alphaproteobacteria bacterium CG_4_10_14_0_8_um_filter_53_9]|nr:MAG: hypothetical protein COY40_01910 [Alphaproteobacteria bacterium CG_4_10_14_0_8_um_filter_53_9]
MLTLTILLAAILVILLYGAYTEDAKGTTLLTGLAALIAAVPLIMQPTTGALFQTDNGPLLLQTPLSNALWLITLLLTPAVLALGASNTKVTAKPEFSLLTLLSVAGALILITSHDFLSLYVGLELMSFPLYILASFQRDNARSSEAGLKYFILGALASGLFLYGVSLFYASTGSTNFSAALPLGTMPAAALTFMLVAFLFKLSSAPAHFWTPDVYAGAPTPALGIIATLPKLAVIAVLLRVLHLPLIGSLSLWQPVLLAAATLSMVWGSIAATTQTELKRLLAYSTIGNMSFMVLGLATGTPAAAAGTLFYVVTYILGTLGLLAIFRLLEDEQGTGPRNADGSEPARVTGHPSRVRGLPPQAESQLSTENLKGLLSRRPLLTVALAINLLSLAGIPPLAGFMAKLNVLMPAVNAGHIPFVLIALASSIVALYYSLNLIRHAVFSKPEKASETSQLPTLNVQLSTVVILTTVAALILGLFPGLLLTPLTILTTAFF